jgi:hypothetical protein
MSTPKHTGGKAGTDVNELRADIAETRAELGDTVAALAGKADVKTRAEDAARQAATKARDRGKQAVLKASESARRQPTRWAGAGVGVAAAAAAVVGAVAWRRSRRAPQRRAARVWQALTDRFSR